MRAKTFTVLALFFLFGTWSWAQEQGGGGGGGEGGNQGSSEGGGGRSRSSSRRSQQFQRPIFLSGEVILDDGSVPSEQVTVNLVCQGTVIRQVHTSSSGSFSFQLNPGRTSQDSIQPIDASISSSQYGGPLSGSMGGSTSGPFGNTASLIRTDSVNLSACELMAELTGFQSERISLGPRRALDNPDVGSILLHRTVVPESGTVSLKTLAAPKKATQAFDKARKELARKNIDLAKAKAELDKAVEIYPEFAAAWQLLGEVHLRQEARPEARAAFERAIASDSGFALPFLSLAAIELDAQQWEKATGLARQALEINPRLARAHYFKALADTSLGNLHAAEESALWVQNSGDAGRYPTTHYILGWIQSTKRNFESAAAEYRQFMELQPAAPIGQELRDQIGQWESLGLIAIAESPDPEE